MCSKLDAVNVIIVSTEICYELLECLLKFCSQFKSSIQMHMKVFVLDLFTHTSYNKEAYENMRTCDPHTNFVAS